ALERKRPQVAHRMLAPSLHQKLSTEKLMRLWESLTDKHGKLQARFSPKLLQSEKHAKVSIQYRYQKADLHFILVFAPQHKVLDLFFQTTPRLEQWRPPKYVTPKAFEEKKILLFNKKIQLEAKLTTHKKNQRAPLILLLPGSGPQDMDGSQGRYKPLRDLAWGLSSQGFATLRFNKRTFQYRKKLKFKTLTFKREYVDDTLAAIGWIQKQPNLLKRKLFILAHEIAVTAALSIAVQLTKQVQGLILMAGTPRRFEQVLLDHMRRTFRADGDLQPAERRSIRQFERNIQSLRQHSSLKTVSTTRLPGYLSGTYWTSYYTFNIPKIATTLRQPMLFLQGEQDKQIHAETDFNAWKKMLLGRVRAKFVLLPQTNHLFLEPNTTNVSERTLKTIARWLPKR
ncbi:MAG: hypothetical protein AAGJ35_12010, partial [Myxococcota bacterium]